MGWMAPERYLSAKMVIDETHHQREPSMSEVTTIGLDLAKHVFQVHGVDANSAVVLRKQLRRGQVVAFFAALPRCLMRAGCRHRRRDGRIGSGRRAR